MKPIVGRAAVTVALLAIVLLPIYWMISTSLKSNKEITQETAFYPHSPTFADYLRLFSEKEFGVLSHQLDRGDVHLGRGRALGRFARRLRSPGSAYRSGLSARSGSPFSPCASCRPS